MVNSQLWCHTRLPYLGFLTHLNMSIFNNIQKCDIGQNTCCKPLILWELFYLSRFMVSLHIYYNASDQYNIGLMHPKSKNDDDLIFIL